jgi:hypothetical protein
VNVGLGLLALATTVFPQDKDEAERAPGRVVPMKVQFVVTKHLGDKKISSLAYSLPCSSGDRKATLKLGVEVPVPVRKAEAVEYQYRNVGANLECDARPLSDGRFSVRVALEQSSLYGPGEKAATAEQNLESRAANPTLFRTSMSQFTAVLRDGQTMQAVSGTDPLNGEVTAVDVTLTLLK